MIHFTRRWIDPREQYRRWIDPRLRSLRLADVTAYLRRRGWTPLPPDRPGFLVFQEPQRDEHHAQAYVQFVPESEAGADYALRLFELLTGIAEFEDRQAKQVIDDILGSAESSRPNGAAPANVHGRESGSEKATTTA